MRRFVYINADRGIPLPGAKGASLHVEHVCRAFADHGLSGTVLAERVGDDELAGMPLWPLERLQDVPAIDDGFVYERYSLWHLDGLELARSRDAPFVLEVNSPLPDEARRHRGLEDTTRADAVARHLLESADAVVAVSAEVADWAGRLRGHRRDLWVVPNGVDPQLFAPREGRCAGLASVVAPVIGFCGSFRPWHGVDDLRDAFVRLALERSVHLLCVGDGPLRPELEARLRAAGLTGEVTLTGKVPHRDVPAWIGSADVAVVPYPADTDFYFSPLKLFEYMALGVPVVGAAIGQIPEILDHGRRGALYRAGDAGSLATAIATLLDDPPAARRLAMRARTWVIGEASWERRTGEVLARVAALPRRLAPRGLRP